jgi:hypothetical protein
MYTHPLRAVHSQAVCRRCRTTVPKIQGALLDTFRDITTDLAWAEDRATQRCDPSAGPGAKTGVRAELRRSVPLLSCPLRDWPKGDQPSRHDAATRRIGCPHRHASRPNDTGARLEQGTTPPPLHANGAESHSSGGQYRYRPRAALRHWLRQPGAEITATDHRELNIRLPKFLVHPESARATRRLRWDLDFFRHGLWCPSGFACWSCFGVRQRGVQERSPALRGRELARNIPTFGAPGAHQASVGSRCQRPFS